MRLETSMTKQASLLSAIAKYLFAVAAAVLTTGAWGLATVVWAADVRHPEGEHLKPTGKGAGEHDPSGLTAGHAARFLSFSTNGISYHGGPVMLGPVNLYYIWYGNWSFGGDPTDASTKTILETFSNSIGNNNLPPTSVIGQTTTQPYFNINATYYNFANQHVSGAVAGVTPSRTAIVAANASYGSNNGRALTDAGVQQIVADAVTNSFGGGDTNGVYFVLTSKDVTETSGFCTQYCAWHSSGTIAGKDIKFGFVGNPALQCPSACSAQATTPNSNLAADAMANLIAHELSETVTDPDLNAWFDRSGQENADKCAWTFGTIKAASNGAAYNVSGGGRQWLLQRNWINRSGGYCTLTNP